MRVSVISFTPNGVRLSRKIANTMDAWQTVLYTKYGKNQDGDVETPEIFHVSESIFEWAGTQLKEKCVLLFIGACGIAVRAIAPHLTDKLHDSPVLVVDEQGRYVIPILSGHMGGANELAVDLAKKMNGVPVITTATDINGMFAVDLFAKKNGLFPEQKEGIAKVSAKVLEHQKITVSIEPGHLRENCLLPACLQLVPYPPFQKTDLIITSKPGEWKTDLLLRPKEYVIGMGCKKGKEASEISGLIQYILEEQGIGIAQIFALASVSQKKKEPGLLAWTQKERIPFLTFTAEELEGVQGAFHESQFVKDSVGVANVCERAALRACGKGGKLILEKHAENGMTIAIAKREWSVEFDES